MNRDDARGLKPSHIDTPEESASRWSALRDLLGEILELPADQRLRALRERITDTELLAEAEQLLGFEREAGKMFGVTGWLKESETAERAQFMEGIAENVEIGAYRVLRELGRGGMGAVYLAERSDGAYQQRVAIKVLQERISSPEMERRFRSERQILAGLVHPGIARLLDGGVTAAGTPYLVLEYVAGVPIDQYCDGQEFNTKARIALFLKVADVVQSAHQQLVLHLDLKPANILITAEGEPRLLDFGIARFIGEDGVAQPSLLLMTPRYASPEQAAGQPLGVASDVFSLGTMLYKLVVGALPNAIENLPPLEAARIIREVDPQMPSRGTASSAVAAELRGDLDLILLKALRKEPARRYATVSAFADDLRRYLSARPVLAHKDSTRYRVGKFLRRNKIPVSILAVSLILLVASGAVAVRSAVIARRQRIVAERRLSDVRDLAHSYVFDLDSMLEEVPGTIHIRHFVLQKAQKYLEATANDLGNDEYLEKEIAEGYNQIGRVQSLPGLPSMSDWHAAAISQAKGVAIERRILSRHPDDPSILNELLRHLINEAQVYQTVGDLEHVQKIYDEEWQISQRLISGGPKGKGYSRTPIVTWSIAILHCGNGDDWNLADPTGSLPWLKRTEDLANRYLEENPSGKNTELAKAMLERAAINRAYLAEHSENPRSARVYYDQAMALTSGADLVEVETRKQLRGFYADYLLSLGDVKGAAKMAPHPDESASGHERGKDQLLSADEADEALLLGRIDIGSGNPTEGRRKIESGLKAYDKLFSSLPEDAPLSASVAHSHFDYAEETLMPARIRREQYDIAIRIAQDFAKQSPLALSTSVFLGRCYIGLAKMESETSRRREFEQLALTEIQKVLTAHPDHSEAQHLLLEANFVGKTSLGQDHP